MDPERAARLKRGADSLAYLAKAYIDACQTAAKTFEDGVHVLEKSYGPLPVKLPSLTSFPEPLKKTRKGPAPRKVRVVGEDTPVEHPAMLALLDDLDKALQGGSGDEGQKQPREEEALPLNTPATLDESQLIAMPTVENPPAVPTGPTEGAAPAAAAAAAAGNGKAVATATAVPPVAFGLQQAMLDGEMDATAMLSVAMAMETAIADAAAKSAAGVAAPGEEGALGNGGDEQMKDVEEPKPQVEAEMPQAGAARRSSRRSAAQRPTAARTALRTAGKGRTKGP